MSELENLNARFGIPDHLHFEAGAGGLTVANVENEHAFATIALQGAHLMTWSPKGEAPVIWLSPDAKFGPGKSIRGGVPICWPWFGPHASEAGFPAHGFARTIPWDVVSSSTMPDGATQIVFTPAEIPAQQWPHASAVLCQITVGKTLEIELLTRNNGDSDITLGEALHTYFAVSDVREIAIDGLDDCHYLDKVDGMKEKQQAGAVTFASEVDRVYLDTEGDCIIRDAGLSRQIRISKTGSHSTVVWNPWIEKANKMGDLGKDGYLKMVCVESANAAHNLVTIAPGDEHLLWVRYSVEQVITPDQS